MGKTFFIKFHPILNSGLIIITVIIMLSTIALTTYRYENNTEICTSSLEADHVRSLGKEVILRDLSKVASNFSYQ